MLHSRLCERGLSDFLKITYSAVLTPLPLVMTWSMTASWLAAGSWNHKKSKCGEKAFTLQFSHAFEICCKRTETRAGKRMNYWEDLYVTHLIEKDRLIALRFNLWVPSAKQSWILTKPNYSKTMTQFPHRWGNAEKDEAVAQWQSFRLAIMKSRVQFLGLPEKEIPWK